MRGVNTVLFCFVSKFRAAFLRNRMGNERGRKEITNTIIQVSRRNKLYRNKYS